MFVKRFQVLSKNSGLFEMVIGTGYRILYIEFNEPIRYVRYFGLAKILGEYTYMTQSRNYNTVPKLKMILVTERWVF